MPTSAEDGPERDGRVSTERLPKLPRRAWQFLLAGLAICEGFSFWTGHPYDFEVWVRTGYEVAIGNNPYSMNWPAVPGLSFSFFGQTLPSAAYLPFWPLLLGGLYRAWTVVGWDDRFVLYFLLKQPGILANAVIAYLLYQIVFSWTRNSRQATRTLVAWSFFPYSIIVTAIWGQFDAIVVVLVLLVYFSWTPLARSTLYGVGIFVKYVTVIFLPLEFFANRGWRRAYVLVGVAFPLLATIAAVLALHWGTVNLLAGAVSQTHGGTIIGGWSVLLSIPAVASAVASTPYLSTVLGYLWVPAVVLSGYFAARWFSTFTPSGMTRALTLVTTVFLLTRFGLAEQYLMYLFPLLALDVLVLCPGRTLIALYTFVVSFGFLLVNNDFLIRFVAPLDPGAWTFSMQLDASALYGGVRSWAIIAFGLLVTAALAQLIVVYARDQRKPIPWPVFWERWRRAWTG